MSLRRGKAAIAFAICVGLVVAACGGDDAAEEPRAEQGDAAIETSPDEAAAEEPASDDGAAETTPEVTEPSDGDAQTEAPDDPYDRDATLTFSYITAASSNYDPHASGTFAQFYMYPVMDALFRLDERGQPQPSLATGAEVSDDGLTVTISLRDDVVFHDGEPFNADAVVANLERAKTLEGSTIAPQLATVETVTALDATTVELSLSQANAALTAILSDKAGMMMSPASFDNDDIALNPVGAGPYMIAEHQPGDFIRYERFDRYWDPDAAKLAAIEVQMQPDDNTRLTALRAGDIDAAPLPPDLISTAESDGLEVETFQTGATFVTYLNLTKDELADPVVRRAMSMSIDRAAINEALHAGLCAPAAQVFSPPSWANNPDISFANHTYDPEGARALLEEAGLGDGFDLDMVVFNSPLYVTQAEVLQSQFGAVGINVNLQAVEGAQIVEQFINAKTVDAYFTLFPGEVDPSVGVANLYSPTGRLNPGGLENSELEQLRNAGLVESDPAARAEIYQQIGAITADQVLHIPVCASPTVIGKRPGVVGLTANVLNLVDLSDAGIELS